MISVILYLLFCYGATALLLYAKIFNWLQNIAAKIPIIRDLWQCSMCLGFWVGFFVYLLYARSLQFDTISDACLVAIVSSGVTWTLCSVTQYALWAKAYYEMCVNEKCVIKGKEINLNE
jgi:hypothetical protein